MTTTPETHIEFARVVVVNDDKTPFDFVTQVLRLVFGKNEREARELASITDWLNRAVCGVYPVAAATTLVAEARRYAGAAGYPLAFDIEPVVQKEGGTDRCSFCGKSRSQVRHLYSSSDANICDTCIISGARQLAAGLPDQRFHHVYELLNWHFPDCPKEEIVVSTRQFPERVQADLQRAVDALFSGCAIKEVGIHGGTAYEPLTITALMKTGRNAKTIAPLGYQDVDIGEDTPVKCLENGLFLLRDGETPCAVLLSRHTDFARRTSSVKIEIAAPSGDDSVRLTERYFKALERSVNESASYRGKVLSLEQTDMYSGMSSGILVHRLLPVARHEVILPEGTLALLDKNVIEFARHREALRRIGQSTKKGLLFYGPPGTGKTHTVRYLAQGLAGHTTLLVTAEQVGLLQEYFTLARLLQPSIVVIEDADLIARDRNDMNSPCEEALLNKLLNEMDGLRQDAEVFLILTTNRPETLESALAARPGRIDQAIEFPLPDDAGRRKLVALYGGELEIAPETVEEIVKRTRGVSAAFIKELMRRTAQNCIDRADSNRVALEDVSGAIEEMLFSGGRLNRNLLGGRETDN
jgi:ATP-dependent Clp protease adapter protein ClpS